MVAVLVLLVNSPSSDTHCLSARHRHRHRHRRRRPASHLLTPMPSAATTWPRARATRWRESSACARTLVQGHPKTEAAGSLRPCPTLCSTLGCQTDGPIETETPPHSHVCCSAKGEAVCCFKKKQKIKQEAGSTSPCSERHTTKRFLSKDVVLHSWLSLSLGPWLGSVQHRSRKKRKTL